MEKHTFDWDRGSLALKLKLIRSGKVKDIYEAEDGNILFQFSDRVSAFDVQMATPIPGKGEALCSFAELWFGTLDSPNHMIRVVSKNQMLVRRLNMIPIECIVRGYFYGSIVERLKSGTRTPLPKGFAPVLAAELPAPIFDPTIKSEEHDAPVSRHEAVTKALVSAEDFDYLAKESVRLYQKMREVANGAGFIMADVKFEFGKDADGSIILADSLGPDEFRLWPTEGYRPGLVQDSFDKQLLRDWLIKTGFKAKVDALAAEGKKPDPPTLPRELVIELSRRYGVAYERIKSAAIRQN